MASFEQMAKTALRMIDVTQTRQKAEELRADYAQVLEDCEVEETHLRPSALQRKLRA